MKIANPLYDHAFKYLMANDRLARKVLSVILEKEVLELELTQQEMVVEDQERRFTLYRLDFKAVIRDQDGHRKAVLIELQKSKLPTNILRFRSYLGLSYTQRTKEVPQGAGESALPIISVYILGYKVKDIPVMAARVNRRIMDLSRGVELDIQSDFIDLLTHESYILQVGRLPKVRRSRIERFMTLFNQTWVAEEKFILDLEEVPDEFRDIAEYLQRPLQEEELLAKLRGEEELEMLFAQQEAEKEQLLSQLEAAKTREEEARAREEEARAREEEARAREEEARAREEEARAKVEEERRQKEAARQQARENAIKLARLLLKTGSTAEEVARETGLAEEEIQHLI
jgi:hypothetical protein